MALSRLKALALTDTPPAVNVRMLPSVPSVALLPEKSNVLGGAGAPPAFCDGAAGRVEPHFARLEDVVRVARLHRCRNVIWPSVVLRSSAVLPGVPLSSVTTTWLAANATLPVLVTLYVQVTVEPGVRIGTPGPLAASSLS